MKALVGKDIGNYTFNATGQTITFSGVIVSLEEIYLITNTSGQTIIFNFASPGCGGTISNSGTTLTLQYNTTTMSNTDELQILLEVGEPHIDFDIGAMKTMELSPLWNRYTDVETLVSAQNLTNAFADYGAEIDMRGYTHLGTFIVIDANDSTGGTLRVLGKHTESGTEEFNINGISDLTLWTGTTIDTNIYYDFNCYNIPYIQLQAKVDTVGTTASDLTIYITKVWRNS
jgi:hypothetical protein